MKKTEKCFKSQKTIKNEKTGLRCLGIREEVTAPLILARSLSRWLQVGSAAEAVPQSLLSAVSHSSAGALVRLPCISLLLASRLPPLPSPTRLCCPLFFCFSLLRGTQRTIDGVSLPLVPGTDHVIFDDIVSVPLKGQHCTAVCRSRLGEFFSPES